MKFRKKPVVIDAIRFTGFDDMDVLEYFCPVAKSCAGGLLITTLEGAMTASIGDWIIKGVKGEFYPCKPDIFQATYEPA